jgi:hypothetical protein
LRMMSLMVNEMHFKLVQLINELEISFTPLKDLKFKFGDLRQISVRLRPLTEREREKYRLQIVVLRSEIKTEFIK